MGVFEAAVNFAETEADEPAWKINRQQKPRRERYHAGPKQEDHCGFGDPLAAKRPPAEALFTVMREMLRFPQALRKPKQQ